MAWRVMAVPHSPWKRADGVEAAQGAGALHGVPPAWPCQSGAGGFSAAHAAEDKRGPEFSRRLLTLTGRFFRGRGTELHRLVEGGPATVPGQGRDAFGMAVDGQLRFAQRL